MHILCIDTDISFCQAIENKAKEIGIQSTIVQSMEQARHPMTVLNFSAYILSSKFIKDRSLLKDAAVSLVYENLPFAAQLNELKKSQSVALIGGKPMTSNEMRYLLSKLCKLSNGFEPVCDWVPEIPEKLMIDYIKLSFEKLQHIDELIQQSKENSSAKMWEDLQNVLHKISGSAGMYGRTLASEICRKLEIQLKNKDYSNLNLDSFYRQLYLYIQ